MWPTLVNVMTKNKFQRMHKFLYAKGLRQRMEQYSLIYDRKIVHETETFKAPIVSGGDLLFVAPIIYKFSTETFVPPDEFADLLPHAKIDRYYLYDHANVRIAIEQKFTTVNNVERKQRHTDGIVDYFDIFNYESSVCTLHLELEFDGRQCLPQAIDNLKACLQTNALVHELLCLLKTGNCSSNTEVGEESEDSLRRPFAYVAPDQDLLYVSVKLDGERAKFEIANNIMYIRQWSLAIKLNYFFVQRVVGHVERLSIDDHEYVYIIIDIFNFSSVRDFQVLRLNHIEAIEIMNKIAHVRSESPEKVYIQKFYTDKCVPHQQWPSDGYLHFYERNIVKVKKNSNGFFATVDLMLKKSIYLCNLIDYLNKLYTDKIFSFHDANGFESSLTHNNCKPSKHNVDVDLIVNEPIMQSLQFSSGSLFSCEISDWTVDMSGCENLWGTKDTAIINVAIVELIIDVKQKKLSFQRIRSDKFVANSINVFKEMCQ